MVKWPLVAKTSDDHTSQRDEVALPALHSTILHSHGNIMKGGFNDQVQKAQHDAA